MAVGAEEIRGLEEGQQLRGGKPPQLFFIAAAKGLAAEHMQTSLIAGVPLSQLASLSNVYPELEQHADGGVVYAWGARPGDRAEKKWERLKAGDICLIYTGEQRFSYWGRVYAKTRSDAVARAIWGEHKGEIWECMYFLDPVADFDAECLPVVTALDYKEKFFPRGFEIPSKTVQQEIRDKHGTLIQFLASFGVPSAQTSQPEPSGVGTDEPGSGPGEDPAILLLDGATDSETMAKVRVEQQKLRLKLLGKKRSAKCALCSRELPVTLLRAAHIKKRSECTDEERAQLDNVMLACAMGCDYLFELGFVYIDTEGIIRRTPGRETTPDLDSLIAALERRLCPAHAESSETHFAWHRSKLLA
jgi:hypothetical protein